MAGTASDGRDPNGATVGDRDHGRRQHERQQYGLNLSSVADFDDEGRGKDERDHRDQELDSRPLRQVEGRPTSRIDRVRNACRVNEVIRHARTLFSRPGRKWTFRARWPVISQLRPEPVAERVLPATALLGLSAHTTPMRPE
jgi:hypothetical protein